MRQGTEASRLRGPEFHRAAGMVAAMVLLAVAAWVLLRWRTPRVIPPPSRRTASAVLVAMTANINNIEPNAGAHSWSRRRGVLLAILRHYRPGILALQAATPAQTGWLAVRLTDYAHWPAGEGLSGNLFSALDQALASWNQIFYIRRFARLAGAYGLLRPHHLATNPTENAYYSLAVLRDKRGRVPLIIVLDTHLRHGNHNAAASAAKLRIILERWQRRYPQALAIVLGDMNHPWTDRPVYDALRGGRHSRAALVDAFNYAAKPPARRWGTWQNYTGRPVADWPTDLIFLSRGWKFTPARIIRAHGLVAEEGDSTRRDGLYPSDHFFVLTTLRANRPLSAAVGSRNPIGETGR